MHTHAPQAPERPFRGARGVLAAGWRRDLIAVAVLVAFTALLWFIRRHGPAWSMEEAMMLQAPRRVLDGAVPGRDFDWLWGSFSLWVPAGVYAVLGHSLVVERAIGAVYVAGIGVALYFIGRRWSFPVALAMGAIAISIGGLSMTALPLMGAIAALAAGLAFATGSLPTVGRSWATGLACAVAVDLRPDFAVWSVALLVVLGLVRVIRPLTWVAYVVGLAPYGVLLARAGWSTTWRNLVSDGVHVAAERRLPWHVSTDTTSVLIILAIVVSVGAVVLGVMGRRRTRGAALLGLGVIGLCGIPEYLQRADGIHVVYATIVPLATVVPVAHDLLGRVAWTAPRPSWRSVGAIALAAVVLFAVQPKFVLRATLRDLRTTVEGGQVFAAHQNGSVWYFRDARSARDHATLARAAARLMKPGDVLFVGPLDLAHTTYADESYYTLLSGYTQTTHFYDFHPRVAQTQGRRLAEDIGSADVVILCDIGFDEGNTSRRSGSSLPADTVAKRFVQVDAAGACRLYRQREPTRAGS